MKGYCDIWKQAMEYYICGTEIELFSNYVLEHTVLYYFYIIFFFYDYLKDITIWIYMNVMFVYNILITEFIELISVSVPTLV